MVTKNCVFIIPIVINCLREHLILTINSLHTGGICSNFLDCGRTQSLRASFAFGHHFDQFAMRSRQLCVLLALGGWLPCTHAYPNMAGSCEGVFSGWHVQISDAVQNPRPFTDCAKSCEKAGPDCEACCEKSVDGCWRFEVSSRAPCMPCLARRVQSLFSSWNPSTRN